MFIIFEGIEGAGKSTHIALLEKKLKEQGFPVVAISKEPGWGSDHLSGILKHLVSQPSITREEKLFLLLADRAGHYARFIRPLLNEKHIRPVILCERGPDSTMAYQGYGMNILPLAVLSNCNGLATQGLVAPLTIVLDAAPAMALGRSSRKDEFDLIDHNLRGFYDRVRDGYAQLASIDPNRYEKICTARDIDTVHAEIIDVVSRRLGI